MTEQTDKKRIDLKTTQVAAGSLASVTSAVAASQLGVAGTLVGAGVGSMVGAVAGSVYEHYLDRTRDRVRLMVPRRPAASAAEQPIASSDDDRPTWTWLRSRRLALVASAAAAFGIALVALTGFEVVTGQPVSSQGANDGGTSIGRAFGASSSSEDPATDPTPTPTPTSTSDEPTTPTSSPSSSPTVTEPAPTEQPTSSPTSQPVLP